VEAPAAEHFHRRCCDLVAAFLGELLVSGTGHIWE
jgi:hypothetical protein